MPTNYTPPARRSFPRPFNNITDGLTGNPDIVLVNYPSNAYDSLSVDEVMFCLRTIKQTANAAGKPCYVTTSQPRNDPETFRTTETRRKMQEIKDRVQSEFGNFAINFWDEIVNPADNTIKQQYNADGTHLNDAGHEVLFTRVRDRNILGGAVTPPPATLPPTTGNGLSYRYYEGDWNSLPDFNNISPLKTGTSGNFDLSVRSRNDNFGLVWQGSIQIPVSGTYTFELASDDGSKFYFNSGYNASSTPLLNNDGLHADDRFVSATVNLNAGTYPIAAAFFEASGNESFKLFWSGPGISRQQVPNTAFGSAAPPQSAGGLNYRYYEGDWNSLPDFNAMSPVKSGTASAIDLSPRNRNDYFGFVWDGYLSVPTSGYYVFELESDDGSQFFFNSNYGYGNAPTVNNNGLHSAQPGVSAGLYINAGVYPVAASFFEKAGDEAMRLYWTGPGTSRQLVPASAFTRTPVALASVQTGVAKGIFEQETIVESIYPNPFRDKLKLDVEITAETEKARLEIYDSYGRLIRKQNIGALKKGRHVLDVSVGTANSSPDGIYILKLFTGDSSAKTFKLIRSNK